MNFEWQVCSFEQAKELNKLGLVNPSDRFVWFCKGIDNGQKVKLCIKHPTEEKWIGDGLPETGSVTIESFEAFTLSEIAIMLGYTFCPTNVKEAADKLITEIKTGASTVKDCNARLLEIQTL